MLKTKELKVAYQELIDVLELVDDDNKDIAIPKNITDEELVEKIQEAATEVYDPNKDILSPETLEALAEESVNTPEIQKKLEVLTAKNKKPIKSKPKFQSEVKAKKETKAEETTEDTPEELTFDETYAQVEAAKGRPVLVNIAKVSPFLKSVIGDLPDYKTLDDLKDFLLDTLDATNKPKKEKPAAKKTEKSEPAKDLKPSKSKATKPAEDIPEGIVMISVEDVVSKEPFNNLFDINPAVLDAIVNNMEANGYDPAFPIALWDGIVVDGNTRLKAAIEAGITEIPTVAKEFEDEKEALEYAIHNQRNRRNITEAELLRIIELLDKPLSKKDAGKLKGKKASTEKTHEKTAKVLGVGKSKVSDARTVLKDEQAKKDVASGKKTISKAAKDIRDKKTPKAKKDEKPKLAMIPVIIETLQKFSTQEVEIDEIITTAFETLLDANGAKSTNAKVVEDEVNHTIAVLVAFGWIEFVDESSSTIIIGE